MERDTDNRQDNQSKNGMEKNLLVWKMTCNIYSYKNGNAQKYNTNHPEEEDK
jgi:hypothetical protein